MLVSTSKSMANSPSPSAPRSLAHDDKPYVVRVELIEVDKNGVEHVILSKGVETFESCEDGINFAQKMWRKFSVR